MKRLFDFFIAALAILALLPLIALVAILVAWKLGRPVFFRQVRPGLDGQLFTLLKFRSMTDARDAGDNLLADTERLNEFGRALRASSLDELPSLINVLKGEMSLVGPRPLLVKYLPLYSNEQRRRHLVRPGLTGWAQVNGRNAIDWEQRLALDIWYVDNRSFCLDLKILILTVKKVIVREGITPESGEPMSEFEGSRAKSGD